MGRHVGIVGGGQLGRMLALAAAPLGVRCTFVDPASDACAAVAARQIVADFDDAAALAELAAACDVVTFEFENVPAAALASIAGATRLAPAPDALAASQDRLAEKRLFERIGVATAAYETVDSLDDLARAHAVLGGRAVLKSRTLGYDGKGQTRLDDGADYATAWREAGERPGILERAVDFECELSVVAVRGAGGETAVYPPAENVHEDGILRRSSVPARGAEKYARDAREIALALLDELDYVGVLAVELFVAGGALLANEFAPRVHNSGHWTIDAAPCSQFENHLRAILDLPLGATEPVAECAMLNLIGGAPPAAELLALPGAHLHLYGKRPRPGRKIGHVTLTAAGEPLAATLARAEPLVRSAAR